MLQEAAQVENQILRRSRERWGYVCVRSWPSKSVDDYRFTSDHELSKSNKQNLRTSQSASDENSNPVSDQKSSPIIIAIIFHRQKTSISIHTLFRCRFGRVLKGKFADNRTVSIFNLHKKPTYVVNEDECITMMKKQFNTDSLCYEVKHGDTKGGYWKVDSLGVFGSEIHLGNMFWDRRTVE